MKSYSEEVREYGKLEPYTAEEIEELKNTTYFSPLRFKRLMATLDRELDRKDTQPPNVDSWWCPTCKEHVHPVDVTYQETHDVRSGGCGNPVVGKVEDTQQKTCECGCGSIYVCGEQEYGR